MLQQYNHKIESIKGLREILSVIPFLYLLFTECQKIQSKPG